MQQRTEAKHHKIFWGSSYDRGLDILLYMWPDIRQKYPDAELHICYGWELYDRVTAGNPERQQWKQSVNELMNQPGVIHHGRLGGDKLSAVRAVCGIWAYPTYFPEINCITALECQRDGMVPVTMNSFALKETASAGVLVDGDIKKEATQRDYQDKLIALMGDKKRWKQMSKKCQEFAQQYDWDKIGEKWYKEIMKPVKQPLVSIITLTIRTGWWNIMAENIRRQTYHKVEWIIVDDYPEDRSAIAQKYAKKYDLDIKYIRGDKVLKKHNRRYGLVRANNIGWKAAKGELLVYLQDFILMPEDGVEKLVDLYRHNPDAFIAPVDIYYECKAPNRRNREDWWDGNTDVLTKRAWKNIRVRNLGIYEADNVYDLEMNYGALPRKIVEELNGWWEFFDDGLGYDNTDICTRALHKGYRLIVDDTNVAKCINLWPYIKGTAENVTERERNLGKPYWLWMTRQLNRGTMPIVRDEALDDKIRFNFTVPEEISDDDSAEWINQHTEEIAKGWKDL